MSEQGRDLSPGEYFYEDLRLGDRYATGGLVVTDAHIVGFAGLSGDFFDIHMDDEFARQQGFSGRLAHGLLGLALTDGLKNRASVRIMAVASLGWNWRFRGPITAGDRIRATIRVAGLRLSSRGQPIATLAIEVLNQSGDIVQDGETILVIRSKPSISAE
jgi:acyl dehydratase